MADDPLCPKCGAECYRDEVDVEVGVIYGPWGCPACGWSSSPEYDRSDGQTPPEELEDPSRYVDQFGNSHSKARLKENVARFGLNPAVIDEVFGPEIGENDTRSHPDPGRDAHKEPDPDGDGPPEPGR